MVVLEACLTWLGFFFDRTGILQASPPVSLHPGYSYWIAILSGTLALTTHGLEDPFFSLARECGKKWVLQPETQAIVWWLKEDSKGKNIFPAWNICPFHFEFDSFKGNKKQPSPQTKGQTNKKKKSHFFFNWIGQTQGLLLKKKEERKEKWLPHPSVLICAYLMINNTLWSIVWCGLCWFEQENTESLLRHLWITSVYPETINERGRLKKNKKNTQICWVLWLKTGDNVGSQSLIPCVGPTAFSHRMKIVLSDHDWAFWIL